MTAVRLLAVAFLALACASPQPSLTAGSTPASPSPTPISEAAAVAIARAQPSPKLAPDDDVLDVRHGTFGELGSDDRAPGATLAADPDQCVWFVSLGHVSGPLMGQGMAFVIDCLTGAVLQAYPWVT